MSDKYYLRIKTKQETKYYKDVDVINHRGSGFDSRVIWIDSLESAYGFSSLKWAQSTAKTLKQLTGLRIAIVNQNGEIV